MLQDQDQDYETKTDYAYLMTTRHIQRKVCNSAIKQ